MAFPKPFYRWRPHPWHGLEAGEEVKLSSFGTFSVQSKSERVGRNPKTGIEAVITSRRVLSFRPSHILKDRVDGSK